MEYSSPAPASSHRLSRIRSPSLIALGAALLLGGCVTGTVTSVPAKGSGKLMIISSPADAAVYMDIQEQELKEALGKSGMTMERDRDDIILRMPGAAAFESDQAEIKPAFRKSVAGAVKVLATYDRTLIDVSGHTDSTGSMTHNMELSLERAQAVVELLQKAGIAEARITAKGLGPMEPLADNANPEGRQLNRRVELTIRPLMHLP
jgi:outer membrane protein OmpA-like peptidoglycan-associated protein